MAQLIVFFIVCTSIFVSSTDAIQTCGPNQQMKEGIDCKSDCCPGQDCPDPCATACKCDLLYHRLSNGTCIPSRECPPIPCPENEHFDSCPVCDETCGNAVASGKRCRSIGYDKTTVICEPACRCDFNYWRDDDDNCVYYTECPIQTCGPNQQMKEGIDCKSDCCPGQDCPDPCATACKCDLLYHRLSNGTCIPSRECPPIPCPENEHFDSCPVCDETCGNAVASGKRCRSIGYDKTTVICEPACRCDFNYWRDDDDNCVYYTECPQFQDECQ